MAKTSQRTKETGSKKTPANRTISIEGQGISGEKVKQLGTFLKDHLGDKVKLRIDGKKIVLQGNIEDKISKTRIKPYLKRFLYLEKIRTQVRILTNGVDGLILYQPGYIEDAE